MRSVLHRAVEQIAPEPLDLATLVYRARRKAAWRMTVLTVASAALTAALIAGGVAARALVHDAGPDDVDRSVRAEALGPARVVVTWEEGDAPAAGYVILRDGDEIGTVDGTTFEFTDTTVEPDTTYGYQVVAVDDTGVRSERSEVVRVTTPHADDGGDTRPPSTPSLTAAPAGPTEVILRWTPSSDDVDLEGYTVYRDDAPIDEVDEGTTTYTDPSVEPGSTHSYQVDAFDASGNRSDRSDPAVVQTPRDVEPPTVPGDVTAELQWSGAVVT